MALTTTITKKSVTTSGENIYSATINMVYADGATVLIDQDFSAVYKKGTPPSKIYATLLEQTKRAIRYYKEAQDIFNNPLFDAVITQLNANVGV